MSFLYILLLFPLAILVLAPLAVLIWAGVVAWRTRAWYIDAAPLRRSPTLRQLRFWRRNRLEVPAPNRRSR